MSEAEKPLHVRVAEALGCKLGWTPSFKGKLMGDDDGFWSCGCPGGGLYSGPHGPRADGIYEYDESWAATGPLIEKYALSVAPGRVLSGGRRDWQALSWGAKLGAGARGATPLEAVCNLILALKEAGKL